MSLAEQKVSVSARNIETKFPSPGMLPHTRREFARTSLAALAGAGLLPVLGRLGAAEPPAKPGKPNSKFAGGQVGLNVPYSFANAFTLARALGGRAISSEISHTDEELKRVGEFADKHQLMVGYHGHATTTPEHWEKAFSFAKHNGANVDLGHFVAGNNVSPMAFIKKHHGRITHVHVKDRKMHNGPNTPFGEGETPIAEVLRLLRDNKWNIQATIEFEYKVPAGSDRMKELARTIKFCQDALA